MINRREFTKLTASLAAIPLVGFGYSPTLPLDENKTLLLKTGFPILDDVLKGGIKKKELMACYLTPGVSEEERAHGQFLSSMWEANDVPRAMVYSFCHELEDLPTTIDLLILTCLHESFPYKDVRDLRKWAIETNTAVVVTQNVPLLGNHIWASMRCCDYVVSFSGKMNEDEGCIKPKGILVKNRQGSILDFSEVFTLA